MIRRLLALDRDLLLIYLSNLLWGLGLYLYFYIQPLYVTQLGATPAQVGLTLGIGGLIVLLLYAPIGLWADRRGRKPVILAGWTLGTLATFAMALAPDWRWLIPALAAYYLSNFAVSVMNGYIAAKAPEHKQSEVFAIISSGPAIGSILAPALGGWIGTQFGLRTVYFCGAIVYTLSTLTLLCIRPQPAEIHANRASASKLLRDRRFLVHLFFIFIAFFAIDVGQVLAPKFLAEVRGYSVDQIGWLGTAGAIGIGAQFASTAAVLAANTSRTGNRESPKCVSTVCSAVANSRRSCTRKPSDSRRNGSAWTARPSSLTQLRRWRRMELRRSVWWRSVCIRIQILCIKSQACKG